MRRCFESCRDRRLSSHLWQTNSVPDVFLVCEDQNTQFHGDSSKEQQNHDDYNMASISDLPHRGPHGSSYEQAVRYMLLAGMKMNLRSHG